MRVMLSAVMIGADLAGIAPDRLLWQLIEHHAGDAIRVGSQKSEFFSYITTVRSVAVDRQQDPVCSRRERERVHNREERRRVQNNKVKILP